MRWSKPLLTLCVLAGLTMPGALLAEAGDDRPKPPTERRDDRPQRPGQPGALLQQVLPILGELNLSEEQRKAIRGILEDARDAMRRQMEELRNQQADPQTRIQAIRELLAEVNEQISAELNDQQKEVWQKRLAELRERMQQRLRDAGQGPRAGDQGQPRSGGPMVGQFARLREAIAELNLSDEQKKQVEEVFADLRKELGAMRDAGGDPQQIREKVRQLQQQVRERLANVLTPEQRQTLQEKMRAGEPTRGESREPGAAPADGNADNGGPKRPFVDRGHGNAEPSPRTEPPSRTEPNTPTEPRTPPTRSAATTPAPAGSTQPERGESRRGQAPDQDRDETGQAMSGTRLGSDPKPVVVAEVGKPAPDLTLTRSDGRPMRLASLQGKPTVIVFGSFSCPAFRQRVPAVNSAAETLGNKINLVYVYTREAHPVGQWEVQRNLDEKIRIDAHKSLAERLNQARQTQTSLKLAGQVVVDDMDDRVSRSFDGFPNGAILLDRDGVVVLKQKWCDPSGWQAAIDDALARPVKR